VFDGGEAPRCRHRYRQDVQDRRLLQDHHVVVRSDLSGHGLDEYLPSVGQPQAYGRTGRHTAVQILMTDDRGTERPRDSGPHRFWCFGPRGPRCERHAAS
jgi:hypothetical protein